MKEKKLVYINIDGFSWSYLERLQNNGTAQIFNNLFEEGLLFTSLSSGLVSITNPMQSAILCGAWSNKTHNFYQHYDKETGTVVKHLRTFDAQNVAEIFLQNGRTAVSVHQFMLENNPCVEGEKDCAYFRCPNQPSNYKDRFAILKNIAAGNPVFTGNTAVQYDTMPDFTALYIDDIDSLGHNNDYEQYPRRAKFEQRQEDIEERLCKIQEELDSFVTICKQRGFYEDLIILITTDHGMTPYFGKSKLPDLLERLNTAGIPTATEQERQEDTKIVALPYTIELSLYCVKPLTAVEMATVEQICSAADYVSRVFTKPEMQTSFGFDERGPEFLISPQYGFHFYKKDVPNDTFGASHDSFDDTSRHIFGLLLGGAVLKNVQYHAPVTSIDLLPSILEQQFGVRLANSTGQIHSDWFIGGR